MGEHLLVRSYSERHCIFGLRVHDGRPGYTQQADRQLASRTTADHWFYKANDQERLLVVAAATKTSVSYRLPAIVAMEIRICSCRRVKVSRIEQAQGKESRIEQAQGKVSRIEAPGPTSDTEAGKATTVRLVQTLWQPRCAWTKRLQ